MSRADDSGDESPTAQVLDDAVLRARLAQASQARLAAGSLLADRYRIVRFLSEGGMGAVYEAEDLQLRERVALKTVRPGVAGQPGALERFKREIQLARRVTHPNVCRIFEFGLHRAEGGAEVAFLTMELLQGETLAQRLKREGRLSTENALPLAEQMAAGLAAAHAAGVIHRDFKPSNVILAGAPGAVRAVVSDFGLAQGPAMGEAPIEASDAVLGTLDYMAPEQVEGGRVTSAADVYAFGVVLYEMLTGAKPFTGGSPLSAAVRRLHEPPTPPRARVPALDPRWETAILGCLKREPRDRVADTIAALLPLRATTSGRKSPSQLYLGLSAAAVLAALGGALVWRAQPPAATPEARPAPLNARPAVAVLGFKNLSQQRSLEWLSTALAEMFTTELAAGGALRAIPGETVARTRIELSLPAVDSLAADTLGRLRENLGADIVVLGSYLGIGSGPALRFRLDVRAQDARSGELVSSLSETGTEQELFALVDRAGSRLRGALGAAQLNDSDKAEMRAAAASTPEAMRLYAEGLNRLRAFDALAARDLLQRAAAADPNYSLAHAALAEAWALLGYDNQASGAAKRAFELSGGLARAERLVVEGRYRETAGAWEEAVDTYRVLFGFFPDDLEHGLRLAHALRASGQGSQALQTLAALRRLRAPSSEDPRIDLVEAEVGQWLGDFRKQRAAALSAALRAEKRGARLLVARAKLLEAYAAGRLGLEDEGRAAAEAAYSIYQQAGDRGGLGWALNRSANVLFQQGRLVAARRAYDEAMRLFQDVGYRGGLVSVTANIAGAMLEQGELSRALANFRRVEAMSREVGDRRGLAMVRSAVANVLLEMGKLGEARLAHAEASAEVERLGERSLAACVRRDGGDLQAAAGDLPQAAAIYRASLTDLRRLGNLRYAAAALFGLGEALRDLGDVTPARAAHEEALALRRQLGDELNAAYSRVALGRLAYRDGRAQDAEAEARAALAVFEEERAPRGAMEASALLAVSLHRLGRADEARAALERARTAAQSSESFRSRVEVALEIAPLLDASGRSGETQGELRRLEEAARRAGFERLAQRVATALAASR
jgi:tetratricopeptide (TPR) repeat protein